MNIKYFVDSVLCVPATRVGNRYIVEAIELVIDTREHKFYKRLSDIIGRSPEYLEKAMRDAKNLGLTYMNPITRQLIFGKADVPTSEYILKASEYYRRKYEVKTKG